MDPVRLLFRLVLGRRLPTTRGTLTAPGLDAPVTIRRDRYGIAYIDAENDDDAWYALGFCQGQDRAFQLEQLLRIVRGTLSEIVGPGGLAVDRLSRRIGFRLSAQRQLEAMDDGTRRAIESFARGVTAGATIGCRRRAHEFALLRTAPTPFDGADVLGAVKLTSFSMASNWDSELARLKILTEDGLEALEDLDPSYPEWCLVTSPPGAPAGEPLDHVAEDLAALAAATGQAGGSNAWAIAPSKTASGRVIVANDPHLPPVIPPRWYLASVRTPEWSVAGACFVGGPGFLAGHNGFAAWGVTVGLIDNTDLFLEEIGPDRRSVRVGNDLVPCEVRRETIRIKGRADVVEEVLVTPRGPIVSPALADGTGAVSLAATWLSARPYTGFLKAYRARSFEEFRQTFESWPSVSLNVVYGDADGSVGWQLIGDAPQRRKGWGTVPSPGWDPETGWLEDPAPFDGLPHLSDPGTGYVATANNRPASDGSGPFLGVDWLEGYRHKRIVEVLETRDDWTVDDALALQLDQVCLAWTEMREAVLRVPPDSDDARTALELLRSWDGVADAGSPAASVFELFLAEMMRRVVTARAPRSARWALGLGFNQLTPRSAYGFRRSSQVTRLLRERPDGWFDAGWDPEVSKALDASVRALRLGFGDEPRRWAWGTVRPLTLHYTVGDVWLVNRVYNRGPFAWGGDGNTVGQAAVDPNDPTGNPSWTASLRMAVEAGDWDGARFVLAGGQSGNPLSPHYDDMVPLWLRGESVPVAWSPEAVDRSTRSTLRLLPEERASS